MNSPMPRPANPVSPLSTPVVFEAIVRMQCLAATYNRTAVTLAPHVLYTRHGELHVDGVVIERDGKPPKEEKVGTFKLIGLGAVRLTPRRFSISRTFDPNAKRYEGETLMMAEPAA